MSTRLNIQIFLSRYRGKDEQGRPGERARGLELLEGYAWGFFSLNFKIYFRERKREWGKGRGRERERESSRLAIECRVPCGAQSPDSEIMT